jgi:hypothetical protein
VSILLILCSLAGAVVGQDRGKDFLPLSVGNQWTYYYFTSDWAAVTDRTESDSGTAEYLVLSSTVTADTTYWHVRETRNVRHSIDYYFLGPDTSYRVQDTTTFVLLELMSGDHRITRFEPFDWLWKCTFMFSDDLPDTATLYRYASNYWEDTITVSGVAALIGFTLTLEDHVGIKQSSLESLNVTGGYKQARHVLRNAVVSTIRSGAERGFPTAAALSQNYPNPFNPTTVISYQLPQASDVRLILYDLLAREVAVLVNGRKAAGSYSLAFDGSGLASGVYIYRLEAGKSVFTRKMLLQK